MYFVGLAVGATCHIARLVWCRPPAACLHIILDQVCYGWYQLWDVISLEGKDPHSDTDVICSKHKHKRLCGRSVHHPVNGLVLLCGLGVGRAPTSFSSPPSPAVVQDSRQPNDPTIKLPNTMLLQMT